jgi:TolB protein
MREETMMFPVGRVNIIDKGKYATGSLQNPAFSPDGTRLSFTRWAKGYNDGKASIGFYSFADGNTTWIKAAGDCCVSQPGSCWGPHGIIFSSEGEADGPDGVHSWDGSTVKRLFVPENKHDQTWEPSWGTNFFVAERHCKDSPRASADEGRETKGHIIRQWLTNGKVEHLTAHERDCRQPNVSRDGRWMIFQEGVGGEDWRLVIRDLNGNEETVLTDLGLEATDASFSSDGRKVICSLDERVVVYDRATRKKLQVKVETKYSGAASFSPDDRFIAYEGGPDGDDGGPPSAIYIVPAP